MEAMSVGTIVSTFGLLAGAVFGATAYKTNFCTMGGVSDMVLMGDKGRFRAWMLAIAVAIIGTQALHVLGYIDIYKSIYLTSNFGWLGAIVGGLMFGYGMTLAGGCAGKNLIRVGGGNLKSLIVVLVMGVFAYMTLRGLIGMGRVQMEAAANVDLTGVGLQSQGMVDIIAKLIGVQSDSIRIAFTAIFAGALLIYCFKDRKFRGEPLNISAGLIIGLLTPIGWYITGVMGYDDFEPTQLASFTFVAPTGDSIQYLMTFSGATINFGIATVGGVILGSFLAAIASKSFHIEGFSTTPDMIGHLFGAAMMGTGGVLALGCTIGQGITGMSTLAVGSLIALSSIIMGAVISLKRMEEGSFSGAFRAIFAAG